MDFYTATFAAFCVFSAILAYRNHRRRCLQELSVTLRPRVDPMRLEIARNFQWRFLTVYALAVCADWSDRGPHIYAVYRYENGLSEENVGLLYATGFVAGAVSATVAGHLVDRFGRRVGCVLYGAMSCSSCITMLGGSLPILFLGRVCGGIATTFLFTAFETWMIAEYHILELDDSVLPLSTVFGNMTLVSSVVAIFSGIAGDVLVKVSGTRTMPFVAGSVICAATNILVLVLWRENFGRPTAGSNRWNGLESGLLTILGNKRVMALGVASCCFEGAMYLFIFFWSPALKSVRLGSGTEEELPFGLIFSTFMCAMAVGSIVFSSRFRVESRANATTGLLLTMLITSSMLSCAVLTKSERILFWVFCVLEACVGAYFPIMGFLKSEAIEDGARGNVYSILRLPLNLFVVVAHSLAREGDDHRNKVFLVLAGLLMAASLVSLRDLA